MTPLLEVRPEALGEEEGDADAATGEEEGEAEIAGEGELEGVTV
jgi:hypothetical protein